MAKIPWNPQCSELDDAVLLGVPGQSAARGLEALEKVSELRKVWKLSRESLSLKKLGENFAMKPLYQTLVPAWWVVKHV